MMRAVAYLRTSSATNVGGDSDQRQRDAIMQYAERNGIEIVAEYYDAAVSGADPVMDRPGFAEMFEFFVEQGTSGPRAGQGVVGMPEDPCDTILIENASRFSRDLAVQIAGYDMLVKHGIVLIPVDAPTHFLEDTPTAVMVRNILGAVSQFEKDNLVSKLRKARDRARSTTGKCEGRKSYKELHPEHVAEAKRLHSVGYSHRSAAESMQNSGMTHPDGHRWPPQAISAMIRQ